MTKEYIEREAVVNILNYFTDEKCSAVISDVESIPAADVAPVVHGKWFFKIGYYEADQCNCSECGQLLTTHTKERANYCPNCGAKMDLEV